MKKIIMLFLFLFLVGCDLQVNKVNEIKIKQILLGNISSKKEKNVKNQFINPKVLSILGDCLSFDNGNNKIKNSCKILDETEIFSGLKVVLKKGENNSFEIDFGGKFSDLNFDFTGKIDYENFFVLLSFLDENNVFVEIENLDLRNSKNLFYQWNLEEWEKVNLSDYFLQEENFKQLLKKYRVFVSQDFIKFVQLDRNDFTGEYKLNYVFDKISKKLVGKEKVPVYTINYNLENKNFFTPLIFEIPQKCVNWNYENKKELITCKIINQKLIGDNVEILEKSVFTGGKYKVYLEFYKNGKRLDIKKLYFDILQENPMWTKLYVSFVNSDEIYITESFFEGGIRNYFWNGSKWEKVDQIVENKISDYQNFDLFVYPDYLKFIEKKTYCDGYSKKYLQVFVVDKSLSRILKKYLVVK